MLDRKKDNAVAKKSKVTKALIMENSTVVVKAELSVLAVVCIFTEGEHANEETIMKKTSETQECTIYNGFTDRNTSRRLFWEWYGKTKSNQNDFFVLSFYGIGGIGKSSLVNQLCREMSGKEGLFIKYDFEYSAVLDSFSILAGIKQSIRNRYGSAFSFPLFNTAVAFLARKSDIVFRNDDLVENAILEFPFLRNIVDGIAVIPEIGTAVEKGILIIDRVLAGIENLDIDNELKKKYGDIIREMEFLEADELRAKMPQYFRYDMTDNTQRLLKPFVIFLDTYEKYINTFRSISNVRLDKWLRDSAQSVIRQTPGILWVISGRDKLDWNQNNGWDEYHLKCQDIKEFDAYDSRVYLESAGITDDDLVKRIINITNGVPAYLNICVDTYNVLKNNGREPNADSFAVDMSDIASRYVKYLDNNNRNLVYMLAAMGSWKDEEAKWVGQNVSFLTFSIEQYKAMTRHSFITFEKDKKKMHRIVAEALRSEMDMSTINEVNTLLFQYRTSKLEDKK